jgi:hypothetical protein
VGYFCFTLGIVFKLGFEMAFLIRRCLTKSRIRIGGVAAILLLVILWAPATQAAKPCRLLVGYEQDKPFHYRDDAGAVIGIDAEILTSVFDDIGCSVKFADCGPGRGPLKRSKMVNWMRRWGQV